MNDKPTGIARGLTNYGDRDFSLYLRRSFAQSMGYSREMLAKPVVGIAYTASGFNNCHRHFPELLEAVKRGVLTAGALPIEFPTISLGEVFLNPTSLKFRNLMSVDTEEMVRAQPMDAVVLMGGCDKTVPAQLMGAVSAGKPSIMLVAGPMMTGRHNGERLGACTDCRRFWAQYRAGKIDDREISQVEGKLATTAGTCAVMGHSDFVRILKCQLVIANCGGPLANMRPETRPTYGAVRGGRRKSTKPASATMPIAADGTSGGVDVVHSTQCRQSSPER